MKFKRILIEEQVLNNPYSRRLLDAFSNIPVETIRKVEDVFGRVHKPYLQKRDNLNLLIGRKDGQLIKVAPDSYGLDGDPHYYFVHAYNCIYECEYCYLQGYFQSPDLVFFVNHDEIIAEMQTIMAENRTEPRIWFHAGEFSDSLALAHVTGEWPAYWQFLETEPRALLELRTKSVNIKPLLELKALQNAIITFSLAPEHAVRTYDRSTPSLAARLKAIARLAAAGYRMGFHFDPIIDEPNLEQSYTTLLTELLQRVDKEQIAYISLGVVRFTREVYHEVERNYPQSQLLAAEFVRSFDNKVRYNRPQRLYLLNSIRQLCLDQGIQASRVYLCMENEDYPQE